MFGPAEDRFAEVLADRFGWQVLHRLRRDPKLFEHLPRGRVDARRASTRARSSGDSSSSRYALSSSSSSSGCVDENRSSSYQRFSFRSVLRSVLLASSASAGRGVATGRETIGFARCPRAGPKFRRSRSYRQPSISRSTRICRYSVLSSASAACTSCHVLASAARRRRGVGWPSTGSLPQPAFTRSSDAVFRCPRARGSWPG